MEREFSFKELYDVILVANEATTINGTTFCKGEPILFFNKIQVADLDSRKNYVAAKGGFDNRAHVTWETTKEINLNFSNGIFSKEQFSIISNYKLISDNEPLLILQKEILESDNNSKIKLKENAVSDIYVYNKATGEKIPYTIIDDSTLKIETAYLDVIVTYTYSYTSSYSHILIGERNINGFVTLQGKTRTKDDVTGTDKTAILTIPKLQVLTNFSLRLGEQANPVVANFNAVAYPTGTRGQSKIADFYFLSDDIDAY